MTKGHRFVKGNKYGKGRPKGSGNVQVARDWMVKLGWAKLMSWANGKSYVERIAEIKDPKTGRVKKKKIWVIPSESTQFGIGKPTERVEHTGPEGGPINVTVKKYG